MLEWFRSVDWETVGGLALVLVLGGMLMYGLDCVRYDIKFPSRRHKRQRKRDVRRVKDVTTDCRTTTTETKVQKIVMDGKVLILRDGKTYTMLGAEVK